ncbi:hypothetical protein ABFS82_06G196500 [Erythranthe guttata]|uniref:CHHC U11-48K-type domain-containing protein n=1 Tax=Erythranthe guttata TaxID=4155 RepID=A0A022RKY0_ERYGU|nr:PREDICTED: U11/U12 small nuclear ribonucleoprotein 48 kDa protein [Erythranthe guttata]XP_012834685.1 PREDICTED: U11/U12 small nuclear ribonucleoprotein 48 kDa protein [Erythranthe guttata]EYU39535.1 hypothetical protein MIMGU_mgv1a022113mg [Erythranthe guttata]|eukprot:XP_012834684.1 PREDICTED: U11/U12 small nuclear ribonucleoprotein 48 kDa protein [Erythranthe guttata]
MNPPPPPPPPPPPLLPPPPSPATFLSSHHQNPPQASPSLPTALSSLSSLLHLSTITLNSLPAPISAAADSPPFLPCPFNPNHRLPPSSLFSHYLNCPSSVSLHHTFQYPLTLHSSSTTRAADLPSLPITTSSDLSVSLQNYVDYNAPTNNFFYRSCPGPVTPSIRPPSLLNLPRVLYTECCDFYKEQSEKEAMRFSVNLIRFLPSEIWAIRSETEAWGRGIPASYSSRILRAILGLRDCNLLHLYDWIVAASPRYGVIIDFAMRNHIVLLVRLCLKAIVKEAFALSGSMFSDGEHEMEDNSFPGLSNQSFECPILLKAMTWLALQFGVLYGEINGKFLAVDVLKECIVEFALHASLFPLEQKDADSSDFEKVDVRVEEQVQSIVSFSDPKRDEREYTKVEAVGQSVIFISEVAAAVAALHERLLIEEKIKNCRNSRPLSAYQRNMEHAYVSKIADEERQKRPDYRPIIDHDGFLWQRSNNQDTNKTKTKEELLAEERDYKRRRMSYRGKKLKRNTLEVMRGIIEEYMEEIKLAGGIGDMSNAVKKTESLASENLNRNSKLPAEKRGKSVDSEDFGDDIHQPKKDSNRDHRHQDLDKRQTSRKETFAEDYSPKSHRRRSKSNERKYHKRERDEHERASSSSRSKREKKEDNREYENRGKRRKDSSYRERDDDDGRHANRRRSRTERSSKSRYELDEIEDIYDPTVSHDSREDF